MVNMNMIVNTSDLVGYEAENIAKATNARSKALAKAVAIWENNQFKSAKRLGGFGMLAITLAACNNDDDDTAAADVATQLAAAQAAQAAAEAAQAAAEAALADINTAEAAAAVPAVAVLTTGVDTVVNAASGDTVSSGLVAGVQALQSIDAINMGEGTDSLVAIVNANVSPQMTGVENLTLSSVTNIATVNLSAAPGVTSIHNNGSTTVLTVESIEAGTALSLSNNTAGATFTLKASDFTGAADSITLSLNNVTAGNTTMNDVVETLNIVSNGSTANVLNTVTTTPNLVNISGAAALTYAEGLTTTTAVDASGMSGTLTSTWAPAAAYSYTGGTGVDTLTLNSGAAIVETVNTGTGNDTVTVSANLADTDVINGGDGTDTIVASAADFEALTTLVAASNNITGFEAVRTTNALDRALVIASDVQSTGITSFTTPGSNANDNAVVTMASGDMTVNLSSSLLGTLGVTDTGTLTTDTVTINNTALVADDMGEAEALNITGYETLNIVANSVGGVTSQDFGLITMAVDTGGAGVLNITGDSPMTANGTTGIATLDASGMTGEGVGTATFTMGAVGTGATTITGSPGRDTLLAADTATTLNGGAGNDVLTGGTAGDTINGGDGIDTINTGAGATATTADTVDGGAGNDAITVGAGLHNIAGGAGDDSITMGTTLSTGDVITGGDGTDTLIIGVDATAATAGGVGGFESLQVDHNNNTTNMAAFTGNVFGTITANAAISAISNSTSSVTQLELTAASTTSVSYALLVNGTSDALDIETTANTNMSTGAALLTADSIETFTIDAADGTLTLGTGLVAAQGTSITITGDNAVDLSEVRAVNMATVDASAMTANFTSEHDQATNASVVAMTVTGPATGALDINTGAGADTVTSNAGNDTIDTNNGNDTVKPGAGTNGITMGAGADTFDGSGFAGVNTVTGGSHADSMTGGTGIDTYVFASGDSVAPSSIVTSGANLAAGDVIYYANGVDVVTNFTTTSATADDIINGPTGGADPTTVIGVAHANLNNAGALDMFASGAWDSVAKTFTLTADGLGADTLFLHTAGGADISDSLATTASTIVLVGVDSDFLLTANLT
jgi:hypothetical protein